MSSFEKWYEQLNGDFNEAWKAIQHFWENPDERAVDRLVEIALDPNRSEDEQVDAAWAVVDFIGEERFVDIMGREFRESSGERRLAVLHALSQYVTDASDGARDVFVAALEVDDTWKVVDYAIAVLSDGDAESNRALIAPFAEHPHSKIRSAALSALDSWDYSADALALKKLHSAELPERKLAIHHFAWNPDPEVIPALIEQLEFDELRKDALEALGRTRDPAAFEPLIQALQGDDASLRFKALDALGDLGDLRAIEVLGDYLRARHDSANLHARAAYALGRLGSAEAIPTLVEALSDDRDPVRQWSLDALWQIGVPAELQRTVIEKVVECLDIDSSTGLRYAFRFLADPAARDAADKVAGFLDSPKHGLSSDAAHTLGAMGAVEYADAMIEIIKSGDDSGHAAARGLAKLQRAQDLPFLIQLARENPVEGWKALAEYGSDPVVIDALEECASSVPLPKYATTRIAIVGAAAKLGDAGAGEILAELVSKASEDLGNYAAMELVAAGDDRGLEVCRELVDHSSATFYLGSVAALASCGTEAARPGLEHAARSLRSEVRSRALRALRALDGAR